jgi:ATP-dependent helicase HrpA
LESTLPSAPIAPEPLPIYEVADAVVDAVRRHRVVVVEGAPGTGKTTQLPQIFLKAGLVPRCLGITQPRRIAAVSVAARIADQVGEAVGQTVGYSIRFDDSTSPATRIKVMTDGILLQEARRDPHFSAYDILMIDEAHERSLNIDFALGLLHRALQVHPTLRLVISSATLHPGQFQRFFSRGGQDEVPCISLRTRTYPLEIHYRPSVGSGQLEEDIYDLMVEIDALHPVGHVLIFLPGEGLIHKTMTLLAAAERRDWTLLPLYGRLTRSEQEQIFAPISSGRKVILSTNLAETSITIDGVRVVIDCGLHKTPWHSAKTGITSLREERISQASATQRAGRAGRVGPGSVYRLYDEPTLLEQPEYTPEEILRVDLSEAVLRLIDLGVSDLMRFAFPTRPPRQKIRAALDALRALGAIDKGQQLTTIGKQMVPFPLSPSLSRMVVEARRRAPKALYDVLVVGAFASVRGPWITPPGLEELARAAHRRFYDPLGDALSGLRLYRAFCSAAEPDRFCQENFVDGDTLRFIGRAHQQLCDIATEHGAKVTEQVGDPQQILYCVASGFAHQLLRRQRQGFSYETLGGIRVALHPSSSLFRQAPAFAVATELMHSNRVYAFNVSAVDPQWLAELNPAAADWQPSAKKGRRRRR